MDPRKLTIKERVEYRKLLRAGAKKYGAVMREVPSEDWPDTKSVTRPIRVFRSRADLVQIFSEKHGAFRMTVSSCDIRIHDGEWLEGYTWDNLMEIKRQCGYGHNWAVEIYPADACVVNVSSMRHLWILAGPPAYAWYPFGKGGPETLGPHGKVTQAKDVGV